MAAQEQVELTALILAKDWQAIKKILDSIHPDKLDAQGYFAKGFLLAFGPTSQRKLADAIPYLETAHRLVPANIQYLNTLSEAYLRANRPAIALRVATQASNLVPGNLSSTIALGRAAWFCGEKELSLSAFADAYRLTPPNLSPLKEHLQAISFSLATFWRESCYGKRVALVRMVPRHRDFLISCRRNTKFQHHYHLFQDSSNEAIERDLQSTNHSPLETKRIAWIVEKDRNPIGLAELVDLNLNNSRAEILVGFPEEQPFGISLEATLLIMEFAFSKIGIHKLISYVYGDNPKSQRNTLHLGFQQEGLLKSHVVDPASGERLDLYINGCLSTEFFQNKTIMKLANRLLGRAPEQNNAKFSRNLRYQLDISSMIINLPLIVAKDSGIE
ncbi:MAG: GNAT family N-acetyltransferase [Nitrosomonas sp.]|nr:GNAT family N-acetyltransferase [Nitrosomonas sp.]